MIKKNSISKSALLRESIHIVLYIITMLQITYKEETIMFITPSTSILDINNVIDISNKKNDRLDVYSLLCKLSLNDIFTMILTAYRDNPHYGICISKPDAKNIYIYTYTKRHCNYMNIADKIFVTTSMLDISRYRDHFEENSE